MGNVVTTFTSDIKRLEKAYDDIDKRNRRLEEQLQKVKDKSKDSNQTHEQGLAAGIGKLAQMATGYLSVSAAIGVVNAALRDKHELENKTLNTHLSVADAQIKALRNLGVVSDQERAKFTGSIADISKQTGMGQKDLYLAASSALSARGNLSIGASLDAVRMAATIAPESGEETTQISGALLDLAKATGSTKTKENLGFLLGIGQKARVTDLSNISSNLVPGIIGVQGFGGEAKDAGALLAALTAGSADATGAQSKTAAINFSEQLAKFLPKDDRFNYDSSGRPVLARKATGLDSTAERIQFLRDNPESRQQFLAGMSIEKASLVPVRDLLAGGETQELYDQFRKEIATGAQAATIADETIAGIRGIDLQKTADEYRRDQAFVEDSELNDPTGAQAAKIRDSFHGKLNAAGIGFIQRKMLEWEFESQVATEVDPTEAWQNVLRIPRDQAVEEIEMRGGSASAEKRLAVLEKLLAATEEMRNETKGLRQDIKVPVPALETHTE